MTTTTSPPTAPTAPPSSDGSPQEQEDQQQFMKAANGFNLAYSHTQALYQDLQEDLSSTNSFFGLARDFAVLQNLCEWVSATQMMTETCASSIGGLMQGAEDIFSNGVNTITTLSQDVWSGEGDSVYKDTGIPILSPEDMNNLCGKEVDQADLFISYLQNIYWDVSGAAFTDTSLKTGETVNPLSSISSGVEDDCQDIMFQMVSTFNEMEGASITESTTYDGDTVYTFTPDTSNTSYPGTYAQSGDGNNYLFDTTDYTDTGTSPMSGASAGDVVCYAMLDWFYVYNDPQEYDYNDAYVATPDTSQNQSAYQAATDFQGINTSTAGVSQEIVPEMAFLSNLEKNSLSVMYDILSSMASIETQAVSNMRS